MKKYITGRFNRIVAVCCLFAFSSCDYQEIAPVDYSEQKIYMPAAAAADVGINGTYNIASVATPGQDFRYVVNKEQNRLNVPLSVIRSGVALDGVVNVNIRTVTDTVTKLITAGVLPTAELLPSDKFTIQPSVTIESGKDFGPFALSVDLGFLLANTSKVYAIAVNVSSENVASFTKYSTTVVLISPAFLVPSAQFSPIINGRMVSFSNTSLNAVSYTWNFGDGSTPVTSRAPSYTYPSAGTYTVTLTATGALGDTNKSVRTASVIIP